MTVPSSFVVMVPSPSLSNRENASLNSAKNIPYDIVMVIMAGGILGRSMRKALLQRIVNILGSKCISIRMLKDVTQVSIKESFSRSSISWPCLVRCFLS